MQNTHTLIIPIENFEVIWDCNVLINNHPAAKTILLLHVLWGAAFYVCSTALKTGYCYDGEFKYYSIH